jgi:hypothetical protein
MDKGDSGTLAVFDYNWGGHIPSYHRLIVESALRAGWRVVSLSGGSGEVRRHVEEFFPDAIDRLFTPYCPELGRAPARKTTLSFLRWLPGGFTLWSMIRRHPGLRAKHAAARWDACRRSLAGAKEHLLDPTMLFFPYLDDMAEPELAPEVTDLGMPWTGLHVSVSDLRHPARRPGMEQRMSILSHRSCRGLAVLDEVAARALQRLHPGQIVMTLPDIADTSLAAPTCPLAIELQHRAGGRRIVGLLGHLSEAKNLALFLDIATAPRNRDLFFLLAGQYEPLSLPPSLRQRIHAAAAGRWDNVWALTDRIASEAEFNRMLESSDVVFAVYRDFTRSSNILTKAALYRRPVLVAAGYCMAERLAAYRLGLAIPDDSVATAEAALRQLLAQGAPNADYAAFTRDFSVDNFRSRLAEFLRDCSRTLRRQP